MWRIFNWLFGWHYIEYRDDVSSFIARVKKNPNGTLRMVTFFKVYDANLNPNGTFVNDPGGSWIPLTWAEDSQLTNKEK